MTCNRTDDMHSQIRFFTSYPEQDDHVYLPHLHQENDQEAGAGKN